MFNPIFLVFAIIPVVIIGLLSRKLIKSSQLKEKKKNMKKQAIEKANKSSNNTKQK
jgi:hypothetical protein